MSIIKEDDIRIKEAEETEKKIAELMKTIRADAGSDLLQMIAELVNLHEELAVLNYRIELDL